MEGVGWALMDPVTGLTGTVTIDSIGLKVSAIFLTREDAVKMRDSHAPDMAIVPVDVFFAKVRKDTQRE